MIGEGLGKMFVNFKKATNSEGNSAIEEGKHESTPTMINAEKPVQSSNQQANT